MPRFTKRPKKPTYNRFKTLSMLTLSAMTSISFTAHAVVQPTITLNDAISLTLKQHPKLRAFGYANQVAQGYITQAGAKTPMMINAKVEDAMGSGDYSALSGMQTTLSISWLLESRVIKSRINLANQQASIAQFDKELAALNVAAKTATYFITLLSQQQQLSLAKLAHSKASNMFKQISRRVKVGQTNIIDQLRSKANLSKKSLVVEDLTHEIEASKAQLAAQWQGDLNFNITGSLQNIPSASQLDNATNALKSNPQLLRYAAQRQVNQSKIALARVTATPAWKIDVGVKRNEVIDDIGLNAAISIPFGGKNTNRGTIAALSAKQQQNEANADAWYRQMATQLLLLTHKIKHNSHVIDTLSSTTIPALEQADNQAEKAYNLGSLRYTDWYAVQQELIIAQGELIEAYTNIGLFNIELERLSGASISMTNL
jgi:cobalt-zinc-cadmium efflux system outer membrane protein